MTPFAEADARLSGMHGYEPVRSRSQFRRLKIQGEMDECATCGKIARVQNELPAAAIYSVAIENPALVNMLCGCDPDA